MKLGKTIVAIFCLTLSLFAKAQSTKTINFPTVRGDSYVKKIFTSFGGLHHIRAAIETELRKTEAGLAGTIEITQIVCSGYERDYSALGKPVFSCHAAIKDSRGLHFVVVSGDFYNYPLSNLVQTVTFSGY